jgi:hypothetical protein
MLPRGEAAEELHSCSIGNIVALPVAVEAEREREREREESARKRGRARERRIEREKSGEIVKERESTAVACLSACLLLCLMVHEISKTRLAAAPPLERGMHHSIICLKIQI